MSPNQWIISLALICIWVIFPPSFFSDSCRKSVLIMRVSFKTDKAETKREWFRSSSIHPFHFHCSAKIMDPQFLGGGPAGRLVAEENYDETSVTRKIS